MDDDFNSSGAMGNLFDLVRAINQARADGATNEQLIDAQNLLKEFSKVFGLILAGKTGDFEAEPFIELLLEVRAQAREQKMWALSDLIRDRLAELGVQVEDAKGGSGWAWK